MPFPIPRHAAFCSLFALIFVGATSAQAQIRFVEKSEEAGLANYLMAEGPVGGAAAADYDADGDIDVFIPSASGVPDLLFRNDGDGRFTNVAAEAGLDSVKNNRAALWFDFDGDWRLDLLVGGDCRSEPLKIDICPESDNLRLYRQVAQGRFEDVTVGSGLEAIWGGYMDSHRSGMVAGDIDNDGYLDLYITTWNGRAWLFRNLGNGTFSDITLQSGLTDVELEYHQPVMYDFNRDGWLDIYAAVDIQMPNQLWLNQGDGTFVDVADATGADNAMTDMGVALGDYDNDLDMDLYVTNITRTGDHNVLLRNDSSPEQLKFSEVSEAAGVWQGYWGWGTTFFDADNDGWLDLAATNGKNAGQWRHDPSLFYYNLGDGSGRFEDRSTAVGLDDEFIGASLIAFDHDRDGDLDLLQTTSEIGKLRLLDNQPGADAAENNWLVVRPRMVGRNRFAIGAEVELKAGGRSWIRTIRTTGSTLGQEPAEAFFGIGRVDWVDEIVVSWPYGEETRLEGLAVNQILTVEKPASPPSINATFSDAWYNPATPGQGIFLVVYPELEQVMLAWFSYELERPGEEVEAFLGEPGHRWYTAQGPISANRAELAVYRTAGGVLDRGDSVPVTEAVGQATLEFSDCGQGFLDFQLDSPGLRSRVTLQRVVEDNTARCRAARSAVLAE